jgi:4-oxalocrotonate tautomerase
MPIVTFHLVQGQHSADEVGALLKASTALFAEVLETPLERVRAFAQEYPATHACIGLELVSEGAVEAPFFQFYLLADRPQEHADRLLAGFTDIVVDVLGSDRARVRGTVTRVAGETWSIAGVSAATLRADEIQARHQAK